MKFVEVAEFTRVADSLRAHGRGDTRLHCRLELYAMDTPTGLDEATRARIEAAVGERSGAGMPASATMSSLGDLAQLQTQQLLVNLVCTLNASFPDYDFVSVSPGAFKKASTTRDVVAWVNQHLAEVSVDAGLIDRLWGTLGTQMPMGEVEVYSHPTDWDDPAVSAGSIWSFGFFVVHSASRRIIYLSCTAGSRLARTPVGYRDSSSRLDDRASPSASPPSAVSGAMAFAAAPPSSSSSVATAVYAGALGAPPQVAAGGPSVSAPPFAVLAPTGRSGSRATSSTSSGTAATAPDDPFSAATALGLSNSGAYTPGASHGAFSRGFPAGSTPTAAALLFPERRNLRQGGGGSRLAPAGSDEGEEDLREGLERQRSAFADDDDDDDGMSGDGDGPRAMADEGDDVDDDDRYGRGSSLKASQDGMFDWEDVDS